MLVTAALPYELAPFTRRLHDISHPLAKNNHFLRGILDNGRISCQVDILFTGVGEKAAAKSLRDILPAVKKGPLLISGTAGALTEQGRVGDFIIADNYGDPPFQEMLVSKVKQAAAPEITVWHKPVYTAGKPIGGRENKTRLSNVSDAFAVDMESAALAAVAKENGFPAAVLRIFSDALADVVPPLSEKIFCDHGFPSNARLAIYLLGHPSTIPKLNTFSLHSRKACRILAGVLGKIIPILDKER